MSISAVRGFQELPHVKPIHNVKENLEPISSALRTIIQQYSDAKDVAQELKGRAAYPDNAAYIEKCEKCAPKMYSERI